MRELENVVKSAVVSVALILTSFAPVSSLAQEYDDLYFNASDRKSKGKKSATRKNTESLETLQAFQNNAYDGTAYSAKNVNPEYLDRYTTESNIEESSERDEYFPEDYSSQTNLNDGGRYNDNAPIINNYYNTGFGYPNNSFFGRPRFGLGYTHGFYGSGLNFSFNYGYPFYGGFYDPFFSPFYDPFYDPFFYGRYDPFYGPGFVSTRFFYGSRFRYYNAYNRGFVNGFTSAGGEVIRTRGGRRVVNGVRSSRSARSATSSSSGVITTRSRTTSLAGNSSAPTNGRVRVSNSDLSRSQNELNSSRTAGTNSRTRTVTSATTRSRNNVVNSRSRTKTIDRSGTASRSRTGTSTYSRTKSGSSSKSDYTRSYKSNTNSGSKNYGSSRSRSYSGSSGYKSRNYSSGRSSGSNTRSRSYGSSGSRSSSYGSRSGSSGSRSRSSSGSSGSRSRSRSNKP